MRDKTFYVVRDDATYSQDRYTHAEREWQAPSDSLDEAITKAVGASDRFRKPYGVYKITLVGTARPPKAVFTAADTE